MEWLRRYTRESAHLLTGGVWHDDGWLHVTDARSLLCVRASGVGFRELADCPQAEAVRTLARATPGDATATTLGDLWAWLDRVERERCEMCTGIGRLTADHPGVAIDPTMQGMPCIDCEGRRWQFPYYDDDADTVAMAGVPVERNRVAWWLAAELGAPETPCVLWADRTRAARKNAIPQPDALFIAAENWRLLTMGLTEPGTIPFKTYRTYLPGAGLAWQHRRENWHAATDWFTDQGIEDRAAMWGDYRPDLAVA